MTRALLILSLFFVFGDGAIYAQDQKDVFKPYRKHYHNARFRGGADGMNTYLHKNLHYPDAARESNIEGRVMVRFLIDQDGAVTQCQVARGIGGGCDEEALRVIKAMPDWIPATHRRRAVQSEQVLPISFRLE